MKKNKTIVICGLPFELIHRDRNSRSDVSMGRCDTKDLKIFLDKEMPTEQQEATLVHEFVHAVFDLNAIEAQEIQVAVLATELYRCGFRVQ